jgi:L-seryl-tRNA(Ser) seleniumtransferase
VEIEFAASRGTHRLFLRQKEHTLDGSHRGDFVERALTGTIDGADVEIRSTQTERENGNSLRYTFTGTVAGETMSGSLDMGEYLAGRWTARRRAHES